MGKLFHTLGAEKEKLFSPIVLKFVLISFKRNLSADLRLLVGLYNSIRSDKYDGASPFKHLKVKRAILKSILN